MEDIEVLEDDVLRCMVEIIQNQLMAEEEEMEMLGMTMGQIGAAIMAEMEEDVEFGDNDGENWEVVAVDVDAFRRMGDPSFKRHFRLAKPTFEILLVTIAEHLVDSGRMQRVRTPLDIPLLMVLWVLATQDTFRSVAVQFMVQPGIVHFHYMYLIEVLREMAPEFIKWPDAAERQRLKERFEAYSGFPGIVGAIDGTHNVVTAPVVDARRYRNRHHTHSFNTMV